VIQRPPGEMVLARDAIEAGELGQPVQGSLRVARTQSIIPPTSSPGFSSTSPLGDTI
jgi:hypothetical protein